MGRPRTKLDTHGHSSEVLRLLKEERPGWRRERLLAVKMGLDGDKTLREIASAIDRGFTTVREWLDAFREGGVELLLTKDKPKGGCAPFLSGAVLSELEKGLEEGRWRTAPQIQRWLVEEHKIEMACSSVYNYLGKLGARLRVPRPIHVKKDPVAARAFTYILARRLDDLDIQPNRPVRVWVSDEMRCGLHTTVKRVWLKYGFRASVPVQLKYTWSYLYGAMEVEGRGFETLYTDTVNLNTTRRFLNQIAERDKESVHVMIYDGAGFHQRDKHEDLPENVRIITLPPYSPELNPTEKLWDIVRDWTCNKIFGTFGQLKTVQETVLKSFEDGRRGLSLIGDGWLSSEVNDFSREGLCRLV